MRGAVACVISNLHLGEISAKSITLPEARRLIGFSRCLPSRSLGKLILGMPGSRSPLPRNGFKSRVLCPKGDMSTSVKMS